MTVISLPTSSKKESKMKFRGSLCLVLACAAHLCSLPRWSPGKEFMDMRIESKTCQAPDGVTIVYSAAGAGKAALLFIHGGLADRSFFDGQLRTFADRYRVIALDLAGHGESGRNRKKWGIPEFGGDVKAVVEAETLDRVILFGNSLGGPVAVEAALLLPGRIMGVVAIDTFHNVDHKMTAEDARKRAEEFRADFPGMMNQMVRMLFHPDADPAIMADAEKRMLKTSPDTGYAMFTSIGGYDMAAPVRRLTVPLRAINGDLYPTDIQGVRKTKADFDAIVMKHMGHYPMLERPDEFNRHVAAVAKELESKS
jgi:pimeloyl-ACP methyl ester carboxylesterase